MTLSTVQLTKSLVRIPSVTPHATACLDKVHHMVTNLGFSVIRKCFRDRGIPEVDNLYATIGSGKPHLLFCGHVDVVAPGNEAQWRYDPFSATENNGYIYGRGVCDMKGAIAAFIVAVHQLSQQRDFSGTISIILTGDEEGHAINGTDKMVKLMAENGEKWDMCITGEPTNETLLSDYIKIGRRGSLTGTLLVTGKQGHVAYPHLANNAIHNMVDILRNLKSLVLDRGNQDFSPSTLQIVDISTPNPVANIIPGTASAVFNIRFSSNFTGDSLMRHIRECVKSISPDNCIVKLSVKAESFLCSPDGPVHMFADCVQEITKKRPQYSTSGGTSDSRFIKNYCKVFDYGLTNTTIHAVDECVSVALLEQLCHIYLRFMQKYLPLRSTSSTFRV